MIVASPALMVVGILATAVTRVLPDGFFLAFLVAGAGLLITGILTRYRADPVFAPPRLQSADAEVAPASTDVPSRDDRRRRSTS
jgi:hypothetical protein